MPETLPDHAGGPNDLGLRIDDHRKENPGAPLFILKKGLSLAGPVEASLLNLLDRLSGDDARPVVLTALSNSETELNPFSGLSADGNPAPEPSELEAMVALLGTGQVTEWNAWPEHLVLLSPSAVECLAQPGTTRANALARLQGEGGSVRVADSIFLYDPSADLFHAGPLEPHETRRAKPWGLLRNRLDSWLRLDDSRSDTARKRMLEAFQAGSAAVTLHVTHSWGGGVARWVEAFVDADSDGVNFQLCSEEPESGKGYGQKFSLYLGNQLKAPVASWWLQPPIQSTASEHEGYRAMLKEISTRYGVGRVVVSSLVGHSLDALATGLPTVQVLHDFFPLWPLLGVHPDGYLREGREDALERALKEHRLLPGFRSRSPESWQSLGRRWRETVAGCGVRVTAPSHSVANLIRNLDPAWEGTNIEIIPHGLPELQGDARVAPREREDGRLRLVIPGRIQPGKGRQLLLDALPRLTEIAQVYLVGSGKDGEAFFGKAGVNVVIQYRREELRDILARIGPHVAGLLSVVPETFSYTLSEMQQMGIPVVATRVGSFEERITDGETGWLVDPDPESLVDRIRALAGNRSRVEGMRERLSGVQAPGMQQMLARYDTLCAPQPAACAAGSLQDLAAAQLAALADRNTVLEASNRAMSRQTAELQAEVEKRTAWAESRERERKKEVERRIRWVSDLEQRLDISERSRQETEGQLKHEKADHRQTNIKLENLTELHEWVIGTASWRFTRPFRVLGRIFRNLGRARAWNPLRWPYLLAQSVRTINTLGVGGALERSQSTREQPAPPRQHEAPATVSVGNPEPPERFPFVQEPDVSIVIPVYNKWTYTAACLRSLVATKNIATFEVIVVDDQSTDETPERLAGITGLVNIRNEQNQGFVGSCNRGAEAARGRYVVMLNNDTQVTDGWLDALMETFRRHPDTGLAGAKLVYPDGTLQEAGGMIFRDGSGWNYGKGGNSQDPEYQFTREVDYCSGACIMMETGFFRKLGGFDSRYAPAYYEDTDLAFRVRERGLKVRVQPESVVVHYEGVTSGTDTGSGVKRYQAVNQEKFLERWKRELPAYPAPIQDPENPREIRRARDHRLKGRVLVIDAYTPEPDQDSGSVRLCYLMDCLVKLGYGVTFMADNRAYAGPYTKALQQAGIEVVHEPWIESLHSFFTRRGADFEYVMISRHYVAANYLASLRRHCPQARFLFDTVDLHYLREERLAELEDSLPLRRTAAQTRRAELAVVNAADATIVVSPVEKTVLAEAAPDARVHVISNIHEVSGSRRPFAERKDLFFVGGYQHPPNIDAARWFVGSIWPLVRAELPDVEFHLIGSKAPEQVRALHGNGVQFHGFVPTLDPWLEGCRLAVAPLRYGAGIKGKVNMSMSHGQPVVATPMAVEGMFAEPGRDILVAETEEEFAASIVRLYQDEQLWNRLSEGGLENVRRYFSVETASLALQKLLREVPPSKSAEAE